MNEDWKRKKCPQCGNSSQNGHVHGEEKYIIRCATCKAVFNAAVNEVLVKGIDMEPRQLWERPDGTPTTEDLGEGNRIKDRG